jgi:hypothetical protein
LWSLAVVDDLVPGGSILVELGEEYAVDDIITLTFSAAALDTTSTRTSVTVPCNDPAGLAGLTLGRLNNTAGEVSYRVTARDESCDLDANPGTSGDSTIGVVLTFAAFLELQYDAQAVDQADGVTVTYQAETSGGFVFDSTGPNVIEATIVTANYLDYEVDPRFDGVVDVNTNRTTLIPGPSDAASLNWIPFVSPDPDAICCIVPAFAGGAVHEVVWSGDFSWITDTSETTAGIQPGAGVVSTPNCVNPVVTATTITADCFLTNGQLILDPSAQGALTSGLQTLPATTYTAAITAEYTDGWFGSARTGTSEFTGLNAGAWTLNGFQAKVAYMPFQTGIGQVIYIANRSSQAGEVTVDWIDEEGNRGSFSIGDVNAGSTRAIGPDINAGLPEAQQTRGRLALVITANVPACDAQLNAQYNVSGDRAFSVATNNCPVETAIH